MSESRGGTPGGGGGGMMVVTDQEIADALQMLLREANPNATFTINGVVQQLESKLGVDLSHKLDFIRQQIHLLFRPQPLPPPPQPLPHPVPQKDHFALHHHQQQHHHLQSPSFHPHFPTTNFPPQALHHRPEDYGYRPPAPQGPPHPHLHQQVVVTSASAAVPPAGAAGSGATKESAPTKKRRGGPGGLNKLCGVSPELQTIVGQPTMPRTEIVKQLWAYIRKNNLQDPNNKRKIICNDELRLLFETDCTDMFKMNKLLAKHIIALEPSKQSAQTAKKAKVSAESGGQSTESIPIVRISDALANFFGTGEREMSQAEVNRQLWEYIKINQLEDPLNSMVILSDAKLQELFGCERINALELPEMLAQRHLMSS